MVRNVFHLLCDPMSRSHKAVLRKGLLLMLMAILSGGGADAAVGDVLSGSSVYINDGTGYDQPSYLSNFSFTVTTVPPSKFSEGAVSVKPVGPISGKLIIPSIVYVKNGTSYYPYGVTEIPSEAFKDQTGITDVLFERDPKGYFLLTIGANAFEGTTGLSGTVQLPRTITSIGDNAFALESASSTITDFVIGASSKGPSALTFGTNVFKGRTITNLHIMGNFGTNVSASSEVFSSDNVTNVYYYGDGDTDGYYPFLTALASKNFGLPGKNLYLPADYIKTFVDKCKDNSHVGWIPETVNSLTFTHTTNDGTYELLLASNGDGGAQLAVHKATLNSNVTKLTLNLADDEWTTDLMPTATGITPDITIIDSKAFSGNDNLQSITIIPDEDDDPITIKGDAFSGVKSLRYVDLSQRNTTNAGDLLNSKFSFSSGYTLTRIPTTKNSSSTPPYQYTKSTNTFLYELTGTAPFGGLPPYTLVFLPTGMTAYPTTTTTTETVYKTDGTTATSLTRPLNENFILKNTDNTSAYSCNNFGVYDVSDLDGGTASGQSYTWYTFLNPYEFTAAKSTYYRQYNPGSAASVCLPFAVDAPTNGTLYTYKGIEGTKIVITPVTTPAAATPYFFIPTANATLSSSQSQTIAAVTDPTTEKSENELHGVYTGMSFSNVSGTAYGMAGSQFTYNGKTYPAGTFVKFSSSAWINPFRAYLLLSNTSGAKPTIMEMAIDNTATGITSINDAPAAHTPYHNIEGMKVESPSHGIYIHNGHKVIMK